jgi:nucleoside-diphosphate-sugar epimerase
MHFFVTGATGFVGGHVAADLLALGHSVTALVPTRDLARRIALDGVRPHIGSVTDPGSMLRGMRGVDGVFHVAGHRIGFADRKTAESINVDGTRNVLEVAARAGVARTVYTSTLAIFSDTGGTLVDESHRFTGRHLTEYDRIKARAYDEVVRPMIEQGHPVIPVLAGAVYGPGDTSRMASVLSRYLRGRARFVSAEAAYCWARVEDSARAHVLAMDWGEPGRAYIIGGDPHTVRHVLSRAGALVGRLRPPIAIPGRVTAIPAAVAGGASRVIPRLRPLADRLRVAAGITYLGDDSRARRELRWSPRSLDDGLPDAVEWLLRGLLEPVA